MNEDYQKAYFHSPIQMDQPYTVITAFNPYGEVIDPEENEDRHEQFLEFLEESGLEFLILDVGAKDKSHIECSAAIKCTRNDALNIAQTLEQDDVFWIEDNKAKIINCENKEEYILRGLEDMYFASESESH